MTILIAALCARKSSVQENIAKSEKRKVLAPKPVQPKTPEKQKSPAKSSKKKKEVSKQEKKQQKPQIVQPTTDGHKSIEEAVAEGLILDPKRFKNEGNLDLRSPMHPKFGEELEQLLENPATENTGESSSSDENHEGKRVVVHPSQCKVFETTNQISEPLSSH
ncbi:unnamed protein product [Caenorhabditis brenneri]